MHLVSLSRFDLQGACHQASISARTQPAMAHKYTVVLTLLLASSATLQSTAKGVHPELLRFLQLPAVDNLLEEEAGLRQTSSRKLQQTFESPEPPFTFDGYGFGYGGVFPGGGAFNNFAVNVYNIIFRDIFNEGLTEYVARLFPNQGPEIANFVPETISEYFTRDVVDLFGFNFIDRYIGQYYKKATAALGELVDAGCTGPVYSLFVDGGSCEILDDGSVECTPPSIELAAAPAVCNLPYRSAPSLEGAGWRYNVNFGRERNGNIGPPAGEYNFGAAMNVTAPYIGFNFQLQRLANDFGVQQWWQFLANYALAELLRIQRALLDTTVSDNLATAFGGTGRRLNQEDGTAELKDAWAELRQSFGDARKGLLSRISNRLGMTARDLSKNLKALNVYDGPELPDDVAETDKSASTTPAKAPEAETAKKPAVTAADGKPEQPKPAATPQPAAAVEPAAQAQPAAQLKPATTAKPAAVNSNQAGGAVQGTPAAATPAPAVTAQDATAPGAAQATNVAGAPLQGKKVTKTSTTSTGDEELLAQLDADLLQMDAQAAKGAAAGQKRP